MHTMSFAAIIMLALASATTSLTKTGDDEAKIRALEDSFAAAFNALEHISVPVDLTTGKADLASRP